MKIFWSGRARKELRAIRAYIARDSEFAASRMIRRIIDRLEAVAGFPSSGHPVHEYPEALLREVHEHPYRIIYLADTDTLQVVTIVHFKQPLDA